MTDLNRPLAEDVAEAYRVPRLDASAEDLLAGPTDDGETCPSAEALKDVRAMQRIIAIAEIEYNG